MNKFLFWLLSLTWGLPMTLIGLLAALVLMILGYKPKTFHGLIYFDVGKYWGGVNFGPIFIKCQGDDLSLMRHEAGHGLQNIMLGFFMPFLVAIPSAARYWWREYLVRFKKKTYDELPDYDSIWFEGWATKLGNLYFI